MYYIDFPSAPAACSKMSESRIENIAKQVVQESKTFDPATRLPLVVVDSTALPEHQSEEYQSIVEKVIDRLPKHDYVMLFFACGAPSKPSWSWVARTYSMLERHTKKRLRKVYIVHESWWVRAVTEMLRGVVSSKFRKKLIHVNNLSQLAQHIDITLVNIPKAVYRHNLKMENRITIPRHHTPIFGQPVVVSNESVSQRPLVPKFWAECLRYLSVTAPNTKGVFGRIEQGCEYVDILRDAFDRGQLLELDDYGPLLISAVVKRYMYELPDPILPVRCLELPVRDTKDYCTAVLRRIPYTSKIMLFSLLDVLSAVHQGRNRTFHTTSSLSTAMSASLIGQISSSNKDSTAAASQFLRNVLDFWSEISQDIDQRIESKDRIDMPKSMAPPPIPKTMNHQRNASTPELLINDELATILNASQRSWSDGSSGSRSQTSSPVKSGLQQITRMGPPPPPPIPRAKRSLASLKLAASDSSEESESENTPLAILKPSSKENIHITSTLISKKSSRSSSPTSPRRLSSASNAGIPKKNTSTRRGKVVAELAAFYEDKGNSAQILIDLERNRKKWSVSKGISSSKEENCLTGK